jgi:class 3 adenylate cyclase
MTPRLATWQNQTWIETDVTDVLPVVHVPALVIEREDTPEATEDLVARLPLAELVRIPGQSALPWIPGTERVAEEIERFVHTLQAQEAGLERVLATVLFTDIVDSTAQASTLGDTGWRDTQQAHDRAVRANLARFRGREVKTMGDGFLATFDGPARAVRCAEAIVQAMGPLQIEIRAGLHTGEIGSDGDDITGLAVAIASRVATLAAPSEILVSSTVKDLVAGSGLTFEDAGEHELKGVPDRWHLYRVVNRRGHP